MWCLLGGFPQIPLLGQQLCDELLGVLELALQPPDHVVQGVVPGGSTEHAGRPRSKVSLPTINTVAPPQVFPPPGRLPLIGLKPLKANLH